MTIFSWALTCSKTSASPPTTEPRRCITTPSNLTVAAGILAVEAYHAGLIRTTINYLDPQGTGIASYTNLISALRASLSQAALLGAAPGPYDTNPDDFGLATFQVALGGGGNVTATRLTDADQTNVIAFARNPPKS